MLVDRPTEQKTLFRDILLRRLSVRDVEKITRQIAVERVRKKDPRPEITALERAFAERFGTHVEIREQEQGGKLIINFFSTEDLQNILSQVALGGGTPPPLAQIGKPIPAPNTIPEAPPDDRSRDEKEEDNFSVEHFSI